MKIKYSPCCSSQPATQIKVIDENTIEINQVPYELDANSVDWPTISEDSGGAIQHAIRTDGELYLTILRRYAGGSRPKWDDQQYHEVTP